MTIYTKRIYEEVSEKDGKRILVDRLWPRGIKKENAHIDVWLKEITPSNDLRKWYHQDIEHRWDEFRLKYKAELEQQQAYLEQLRQWGQQGSMTLLTAVKNEDHNHLTVLLEVLNHPVSS